MNRRTSVPRFLLAALIYLAANAAAAANPPPSNPPTVGSYILPKVPTVLMAETPGSQKTDGILLFDWPQKVRAVNGRWVQIVDDGGYALPGKPAASRWVRKDDVVILGPTPNGVLDNYTGAIATAETSGTSQPTSPNPQQDRARLYWLRGIYWQTPADKNGGDQPDLAYQDFCKAIEVDPKFADAWLRRGQMAAQLDPSNQLGADGWMVCFVQAYTLYVNAAASASTGCCPTSQTVPCTPAAGADAAAVACPFAYSTKCPPQFYLELGLAYKEFYNARSSYLSDAEAQFPSAQKLIAAAHAWKASADRGSRLPNADFAHVGDDANEAKVAADRAMKAAKLAVTRARQAMADTDTATAAERRPPPVPRPPPVGAQQRAHDALASADDAINAANAEIVQARGVIDGALLPVVGAFNTAAAFLKSAEDANPNWFRPGSALGDLYLARAEAPIGDLNNPNNFDAGGVPNARLDADDLLNALYGYESSIRLNDQSDESLRGRANILKWLAIAKLKNVTAAEQNPSNVARPNRLLRRLLAGDEEARTEALDAAYVSATAASSATYDRIPKDLEAKAQIEIQLAFNLQASISVEFLGQAQETLRQASWYTRSTRDLNRRNDVLTAAAYYSDYELARFASQDDARFRRVRLDAQKLVGHVDHIWNILGTLPSDDDTKALAKATAAARRAIREITELEPFPTPHPGPAAPGAPAGVPAPVPPVAPAPVGAAAPPAASKVDPAYGGQPWPDDQLPMRFELGKRLSRIRAWESELLGFRCAVRDALVLSSNWSAQPELSRQLQQALRDATNALPTSDADCE